MRQWLLEAAPALYLRFGDPQSLALPDKRAVLQAVVTHNQGRELAWLFYAGATRPDWFALDVGYCRNITARIHVLLQL